MTYDTLVRLPVRPPTIVIRCALLSLIILVYVVQLLNFRTVRKGANIFEKDSHYLFHIK